MTENMASMLVDAKCTELFGKKPKEMDLEELLGAISYIARELGYNDVEKASNNMLRETLTRGEISEEAWQEIRRGMNNVD